MDQARENIDDVPHERLTDEERLRDSLAFWTAAECIRGDGHPLPNSVPSREWYGVRYDASAWSPRTTEQLWRNA